MMYVIPSRVVKVEEKFITMAVTKTPDGGTQAHRESLGWFILLEGSSEFLHVGHDKPDLSVNDVVEITIRRRKA